MRILFALLWITLTPLVLSAQPGTLDPEFGIDRYIKTDFDFTKDFAYALALQSNGKVVLAGYSQDGDDQSLALARYNTDGTPDTTFSSDGERTRTIDGDERAFGVAIQPNGKIVAVGEGDIGPTLGFVVARFNVNGSNDDSFSSDGIVTTAFTSSNSDICSANSLIIQPDSKILAAGYSENGSDEDFAIARYNSDGSLDNSFDIDGKLLIDFNSQLDVANAMAIQADGKIILAGSSKNVNNSDAAICRLMPDGSLDLSFGINGRVLTDLSAAKEFIYAVALQTDGKIVVAGQSGSDSNSKLLVIRYTPNGIIDSSFASNGIFIHDIPNGSELIRSFVIQPDEKLLVAGIFDSGSNKDFMVARITSDGIADNSFDQDGIALYNPTDEDEAGYGVQLKAGGEIVVAGSSDIVGKKDFILIQLDADGSLHNFFYDGKTTLSFSDENDELHKILIQPDSKIIAIGHSYIDNESYFAIARFLSDGRLDYSFGNNGKVTYLYSGTGDPATTGVLQQDGKIIAGGQAFSNDKFLLTRLTSEGLPDSTFGTDGVVTSDFGTESAYLKDIALQTDGKIVITGYDPTSSSASIFVKRFNSNGTVDSTFGVNGIASLDFSGGRVYTLAIQSDEKIVIAGNAFMGIPTYYDFALARFLNNGILDNTFDNDGKLTTNLGNSWDEWISDIAILQDGKILAFGKSDDQIKIIRYDYNGSVDSSFGAYGIVTIVPDPILGAISLIIQPDDKIVAVMSNSDDFLLMRFSSDGQLDLTFGNQGIVITDFNGDDDDVFSAAMQPDGKIVAGGRASNGQDDDFAITRYLNDIALPVQSTLQKNISINVFPNPATGIIYVQSADVFEFGSNIALFSIEGKKLLEKKVGPSHKLNEQFDLSRFAPGIYLFTVTSANATVRRKVELIR